MKCSRQTLCLEKEDVKMIVKYSFELRKSEIFLDDVNIKVEPDQVRQYLSKGELTFYHARGIIVGCGGAGKTTLLKRLMDTPFEQLAEIKSTNIVDVHVNVFSVMDKTIQGKLQPHSKLKYILQSVVDRSCHFMLKQ